MGGGVSPPQRGRRSALPTPSQPLLRPPATAFAIAPWPPSLFKHNPHHRCGGAVQSKVKAALPVTRGPEATVLSRGSGCADHRQLITNTCHRAPQPPVWQHRLLAVHFQPLFRHPLCCM